MMHLPLQRTMACVIDLQSGSIVWCHPIDDPLGNMRTPQGASRVVRELLSGLLPAAGKWRGAGQAVSLAFRVAPSGATPPMLISRSHLAEERPDGRQASDLRTAVPPPVATP